MSTINAVDFPIVHVSIASTQKEKNQNQYFIDYEHLLQRGEKFVLINEVSAPDVEETKSDKAHMKKMNLWMKQNRVALSENVLAMIQVEPDAIKRQAAIDFQTIFQKYWGHKLIVVETYEEALALAKAEVEQVNEQQNKGV
ncbi:hypothetical protein [Myroides odoratus]|uniref:Uncharacterized protein n=1 Tax=Myroides odoratus TaxID=256 RepID=A0A9Q6ZJ85_MYROD|nr:hypothetical protein [Myroides odoratus]EHQ44101.1 hypothetical protein Myrod_3288 [Myroides odoratus DSM 2801]EKB05492.1 hypothetical protein HMPREF9716_02805 [Myroides odoratus CIP 103059]QQU01394.1 hypothetical protein I6I88_06515 [Myroides odoratus]WQD56340.1 hypothetical protein U0010_12500 [Myroides odoratus]STZ31396.1 Uncharacterised protein [Myroides odoratus]